MIDQLPNSALTHARPIASTLIQVPANDHATEIYTVLAVGQNDGHACFVLMHGASDQIGVVPVAALAIFDQAQHIDVTGTEKVTIEAMLRPSRSRDGASAAAA